MEVIDPHLRPAAAPCGAEGRALETMVEHLSQAHFLRGAAQWQSANLAPLLLIGLCSLYLPDWKPTALFIALNLACGAAMFAVSQRLARSNHPPDERGLWRWYNWLAFGAGASWAGLMWPVAPTLGEDIASTFVCVIIIASVAVTSMVMATQRASFVHFLAGLILCLLPQTIIHIGAIGPIPLVATIALAPALWGLAGAVHRQDRSLIRTQLEKEHLAQELARALEQAEFLANRDSLTGLYNRRAFEKLAHEVRSADPAAPLCLVLIDLDHFKAINDTHGHAAGDAVLQMAAQIILEDARPSDVLGRGDGAVARWGGEEFLLLLPHCPMPLALLMAERLRARLAAMADPSWPEGLAVSGSFGVACWRPEVALHQCISEADQAMYRAKQAGRNRVEAWEHHAGQYHARQNGDAPAAQADRIAGNG
jgi:diguanylate cyclase (GGDEF)-like protein